MIKPAGFRSGQKYPAIVMVYGGPHSQSVRNAWAGATWDQALAHRGFIIWQLDNRGPTMIDDPKTYTRRVRISIPYTAPAGYQMLPYECHEGNSAVRQGLGGERAEDRKLEEDAKKGIIRPRRPIQGELGVGGNPIGDTPGARGAGPGPDGGEAPPQGR